MRKFRTTIGAVIRSATVVAVCGAAGFALSTACEAVGVVQYSSPAEVDRVRAECLIYSAAVGGLLHLGFSVRGWFQRPTPAPG